MLKNSLGQIFLSHRFAHLLRWILFLYVADVLCPIRYLEFNAKDVDNTWLLALSYGAAHHLAMGRDIAWTTGPLAYLAAPLDIGSKSCRRIDLPGRGLGAVDCNIE